MSKLAAQLMSVGLLLGMGVAAAPAIAQDSGIANTAEDFKSVDSNDGFLGSNVDIWDIFHQSGTLSGAGVVDDSFRRSQSRRINTQAESLRARQQAIIEQRATEATTEATAEPVGDVAE
ncbi:MAG: hypothetical protein WA885_13590 [Phormidesmis sp.]